MNLDQARNLAPKATHDIEWIVKGKNFKTNDIVYAMTLADKEAAKYDYTALANAFKGATDIATCENIYKFLKYNIAYVGDLDYQEICQLPHTLLSRGKGDCKSYGLYTVRMLKALGINCFYRYAQYNRDDFEHVYCVAILEKDGVLKEIIVDPVPGGSFIYETPYTRKMDKQPMGYGVGIMRGINGTPLNKPFFDYTAWTGGEFDIQLRKDFAKMLLHYHPDSPKANDWKAGIVKYDNALFNGLHNNPKISGYDYFAETISRASKITNPAAEIIDFTNRKHIGEGVIPIESMEICNVYNSQNGFWDPINNRWENGSNRNEFDICQRRIIENNEVKRGLNEYLEKFAARYLYNWEKSSSLDDSNGVKFETKTKIVDHQRLFSDMVSASKLSNSNMLLWSELGIGRMIAKETGKVLTPLDGIQALKDNPDTATYDENGKIAHIGEPFTIMAAIAWAIIIGVSGSVVAGIVQAIQKKEPTALGYIDKIIGKGWQATGKDWKNEKTDTKTDTKTDVKTETTTNNESFFQKNKKTIAITAGVLGVAAGTGLILNSK